MVFLFSLSLAAILDDGRKLLEMICCCFWSLDVWRPGEAVCCLLCLQYRLHAHTAPLLRPVSSLCPNSFFPTHLYRTSVLLSSFLLAHILLFHVFCTTPPPPPPPLLCPSSLSLFFLRALGGAPCGPVVEAFLH